MAAEADAPTMGSVTTAGILKHRDVVRVAGADADSYLQGQISQDVESLHPGRSAWSLVLEPHGKVNSWFRITKRSDDFLLDLDAGYGDALVARLNRFRLRVRATIEPLSGWQMLAVRNSDVVNAGSCSVDSGSDVAGSGVVDAGSDVAGSGVVDAGSHAAGSGVCAESDVVGAEVCADLDVVGAEVCAEVDWPGFGGVDLLGRAIVMPPGLYRFSENEFEMIRIRAGWPAMGSELTEHTIPAEVAGLIGISVSFTKGCYTGQELVARIDSRGGNVPRPIRLIQFDDPVGVSPGAEIIADGAVVGRITSSAVDERASMAVALGTVHRRVVPPAPVLVDGSSAVVHALR